MEAVHDILESDEIDKLFDDFEKKPVTLFHPSINNEDPPSCDNLQTNAQPLNTKYINQNSAPYEEELKEVTGFDETDLFRKRMFMDKNFSDMLEFMLEDTIFNLMEEATYEEFDLTQAPKIYIRKDDVKLNPKNE